MLSLLSYVLFCVNLFEGKEMETIHCIGVFHRTVLCIKYVVCLCVACVCVENKEGRDCSTKHSNMKQEEGIRKSLNIPKFTLNHFYGVFGYCLFSKKY